MAKIRLNKNNKKIILQDIASSIKNKNFNYLSSTTLLYLTLCNVPPFNEMTTKLTGDKYKIFGYQRFNSLISMHGYDLILEHIKRQLMLYQNKGRGWRRSNIRPINQNKVFLNKVIDLFLNYNKYDKSFSKLLK